MIMERIYVRDAVREDAPDVARMILLAWPVEEFLKMNPGMTQDDFTCFIRKFVEADDNLYSHLYTSVAVLVSDDGTERIVGAMNGYDGALYRTLKQPVLDAMKESFGSGNDFASVVETEAGEFYLDSVGVDPSMRSRGIGSMLFDAMIQRAVRSGFKVVGLIVDEDKPKAEALYLRLGFRTVGFRDFLGHRMKHMQKELQS